VGNEPSYPAQMTALIRFGPEDAFGVASDGIRTTAKRAVPVKMIFNTNEGTSFWEAELIESIKAYFEVDLIRAEWNGNILTLKLPVQSVSDTTRIIASAVQVIPAILSLYLQTFVWIKEFLVNVNESQFRYEISTILSGLSIATKEQNQERAVSAIHDWLTLNENSVRIVMA